MKSTQATVENQEHGAAANSNDTPKSAFAKAAEQAAKNNEEAVKQNSFLNDMGHGLKDAVLFAVPVAVGGAIIIAAWNIAGRLTSGEE